jgi:membrane protease YdiL (CAAX protease family)
VDELTRALPLSPVTAPAAAAEVIPRRQTVLPTWFAALQALLICGFPTLMLVYTVLILGTQLPVLDGDQNMTLEFIALTGLLDTALVALLIRVFLMLSGETSRDVFLGLRPLKGEILRGLIAIPFMIGGVNLLMWLLRILVPSTHTVAKNPYEQFMHNPIDATILMITVVIAGGIREELQRAFILHRFEQRLGGIRIGLTIFTVIFGVLHYAQGVDAALTVGLLGLCWGLMYYWRRSAVAGMVSHAGFNSSQILMTFFGR